MGSKSLYRLIKIAFAFAFALLLMLPIGAMVAADEEPSEPEEPISGGTNDDVAGVSASKYIYVLEDGTYTIDLEAFATGEVETSTEIVPCDVILVLDTSQSMSSNNMTTAVTYNQASTTGSIGSNNNSNFTNNSYFYKVADDDYRQITVTRTGRNNNRTWTIQVAGKTGSYTVPDATRYSLSLSNLATAVGQWMGDSGAATLYTQTTTTVTRLQALKNAVNIFLEEMADNNAKVSDPSNYSRVSIVTFDQNVTVETGTKNQTAGSLVSVVWSGSGDNRKVVSTETNPTDMEALVNRLSTEIYTHTDDGMEAAEAILNNLGTSTTRNHIVVLFTDGYPAYSTSGNVFECSPAADAVTAAYNIKNTHKATVFSVAVLEGADETADPTTLGNSAVNCINKMLHIISSNFQSATATGSGNITGDGTGSGQGTFTVTFGSRAEGKHYFAATSAEQLSQIFQEIAHNTASTETPLTSEAVMKDIVSSSFSLPPGADEDDITVSIIPWDTTIHNWSTTTSYTVDGWKTKTGEQVSVAISEDGKTVDLTGFDYAKHFLATTDEALDLPNGVNKDSAKIKVTFRIIANPNAVTGGSVATNGEKSGIYLNGNATEPIVSFPVPEVTYTPVTYVVDYVTSDTSTDTKASSVKLEYENVLGNVEMLDKPGDDYMIGEDVVDFDYTIYEGKYGTISFGDDETDVQRRYVRYAPTTMNWDGYDRIFVKGKSASDSTLDVWAMLCVIPANSVFYEDTYITQTKTVTYNGQQVQIVYTGINYTGNWNTVGTEGKNQTQHAGDEMGWITGLADDSNYANDMAHMSKTAKAKASFTFSGTGVDIYSRINGATGTVAVKLQGEKDPETGKRISKSQVLDTKAATGDFFATPVCTFTDLPYGKYTVTITITTGGQSEDRMTFYLDGVRVYNPIQPLENDGNVADYYGEENLGAVFTEVRSMLLADPAGAEAEALYIDEHTVSEIVPDVEAIETAAQNLADAQAARDEYVENTITPAKIAVDNEEYALAKAKSDVTSAQNIYDAAAAALAADPENEALQADFAEAETKLNAAISKRTEAQDHYDEFIDGLNDALVAAIAGRADYDADIELARQAYEDASQGTIELAYTTEEIAEYKKEGPNHEVLLDKGQSVAISVEPGKTYFIGLKALNGNEVKAKIGNETVTLSHSVDLYYRATPVSGKIVITNDSASKGFILSVTKLRTTGAGNTTSGAKLASTEETLNVVRSLAKGPVSAYAGEILTEEEAAVEETVVEEVIVEEEPALEEETVVMLDESEITIENAEPAAETETVEAAPEPATTFSSVANALAKLMSSFSRFFRR